MNVLLLQFFIKELTTWILNFRDVVLYEGIYLSWSVVSYLKLWKKNYK